jgi:hypothetical protein
MIVICYLSTVEEGILFSIAIFACKSLPALSKSCLIIRKKPLFGLPYSDPKRNGVIKGY